MKRVLSIILCFYFLSINAQVAKEELVGNWSYHRFETNKEIDSIGKIMMVKFFSDMSVNITSDNNYQMTMMRKKEEGKWKLEENKLFFTSTKGIESSFQIVKKEPDTLKFEMKPNEFLILKKSEQTLSKIDLKVDDIKTISVDKKQVSKKWFITKKIVPNKTEKQLEMISILLEGSYIDFNSNGKYDISILSIEESGKWYLSDKNDEIIQERSDDTKVFWKILKISENELLLNKGDLKEQYLFSTSEK
ncbi:lipocalin-like protein [Flavobacterium croceum DSM 17960]|uniref:Lipocalin-like protein n=1 Tax=Flavobacterium croceum DSM 17960 TaxID=1121886 RepID=A0A2S4N7W8_9FLAO|nr:lipocalin family protein [Flavobacterium croceum]POS01788.1 lipocalin-like protein [Flavobacterium croceum DSM 17960]